MALLFATKELFIVVGITILAAVAVVAFMKFLNSRQGKKIAKRRQISGSNRTQRRKEKAMNRRKRNLKTTTKMPEWFLYAIAAAVLYGLHQIFTKLASAHIGDGVGGFIVEISAALIIGGYLIYLKFFSEWKQPFTTKGLIYSVLTGLCVGAGTVAFFLLFQKGGPLSAIPMVLAGGAALMAIIGTLFFKEPATMIRVSGIVLSLLGLFLLRYSPAK